MVFGRRKRSAEDDAAEHDTDDTAAGAVEPGEADDAVADDAVADRAGGPWDVTELSDADTTNDTDDETDDAGGEPGTAVLDLGSVRVPVPDSGQIQVEMDPAGAVRSVHLATSTGRITVAAFAAPRSPGQWREVAGELAAQLRTDGAAVRIQDGPWGREVVGVTGQNSLRFLGVDGPRWMVRCVVTTTPDADEALSATARDVLADTVVVRGTEPLPVRTALPVVLPELLVEQLRAAQAQAQAQQAVSRDAATEAPVAPQPPGGGTAMTQRDGEHGDGSAGGR